MARKKTADTSAIHLHFGHALVMLAGKYATLLETVLEAVQNALDADARKVRVVINYKARVITVYDNGRGASRDQFEKALSGIARSIKRKGKMGRFGLGMIAPVGKCNNFTFTSYDSALKVYACWTFNTSDLRGGEQATGIPYKQQPELFYAKNPKKAKASIKQSRRVVWWRTCVQINQFTDDRVINAIKLSKLAADIQVKYGRVMKDLGAVVELELFDAAGKKQELNVYPPTLEGSPLDEVIVTDTDAGSVVFRLAIASNKHGKRRGQVVFGELNDNHRIDATTFLFPVSGDISPEVQSALRSGIFEGEILGEKIELHPSRKSFKANAALMGYCAAMETWFFDRGGQQYIREAQDERRHVRFQEVGRHVLASLVSFIRQTDDEGASLYQHFSLGSIGVNHTPPLPGQEVGQDDITAITALEPVQDKTANTSSKPGKQSPPKKERPGHHPATVAGPKGKRRTEVKSSSVGLHIRFEEMRGSSDVYEFDVERGTIIFNVRHPLFVACDEKSANALSEFVLAVCLDALAQLRVVTAIPDSESALKQAFTLALEAKTFIILNQNTIKRRLPKRAAS